MLPGGSTNVLARTLGLADDPVQACLQLLDALDLGLIRRVSLGRVDALTPSNPAATWAGEGLHRSSPRRRAGSPFTSVSVGTPPPSPRWNGGERSSGTSTTCCSSTQG
ncbi:MAG: hypothetical protein IPN02_03610 [Candidatus Microthrix sp.]|uniref:DAGKc domain-containing protein n=1 Tax=Candidatus Neomicrothrix subdominans TaxID=2954438 RepID=A0A936TC05_9ACTN|nr:hypothetical protein [Candidatus Microthrix subdominans]